MLNGTKAFLPIMLSQREGCIVNFSSVFGLVGYPTHSAYNMSKFGVRGLTESLWSELAGTGVRAVCVHPGGIRTGFEKRLRMSAISGARELAMKAKAPSLMSTSRKPVPPPSSPGEARQAAHCHRPSRQAAVLAATAVPLGLYSISATPDALARRRPVMSEHNYTTLRIECERGVAFLTLDYGELNLMDMAMLTDLDAALNQLEADSAVKVVVLQSANPDFFIAHADLNVIATLPRRRRRERNNWA